MDGRAGSAGVAEQVDQGHAVVGFLVSAVPASLIMQVADADLILPAKVSFLCFFLLTSTILFVHFQRLRGLFYICNRPLHSILYIF